MHLGPTRKVSDEYTILPARTYVVQKIWPHAVAVGALGSMSHARQCQVTSIVFVGAAEACCRVAAFGFGVSAAVGTVSSVSDEGPEDAA